LTAAAAAAAAAAMLVGAVRIVRRLLAMVTYRVLQLQGNFKCLVQQHSTLLAAAAAVAAAA
jgi:hypothetical protein